MDHLSVDNDKRARTFSVDEEIEACLKFVAGEEKYKNDLIKGRDIFLRRLRVHIEVNHRIITAPQIEAIFSNYETLVSAHIDLHRMMMDLRIKSPRELHAKLGQLICEFVPFFKMYIPYVANQNQRKEVLDTLNQGSMLGGSTWKTFLLINEKIAESSLKFFLDAPEQRLAHYAEDLANLAESFSDTEKPSARGIFLALTELNVILTQITEKVKDLKNRRELAFVKNKLFPSKNITLATPTRFVVKKGSCKIVYKDKLVKVKIVLCSDMIFVQKPAKSWGRGGGLAFALAMKGMEMEQGAEGNEIENSFHPKCRLGLQNSIAKTPTSIINFHDEKQCLKWVEEIQKRIDAEELTERPCNPVGLMKRLRNEKTSGEEVMEYMQVTDKLALERIRTHNIQKYSDQRSSRIDLLTGFNNSPGVVKMQRSGSLGGSTMPSESPRTIQRAATTEIPRNILDKGKGPAPRKAPPPIPSSNIPPPSRQIQRAATAEIRKVQTTQPFQTTQPVQTTQPLAAPDSAPTLQVTAAPAAAPKRKSKHMGLLAGIQKGANLKKVKPAQKTQKKKSFLDDIKGGGIKGNLKKASKRKLQPKKREEDNSLLSQVKATLANYRNVVMDSDDESESGSGWD